MELVVTEQYIVTYRRNKQADFLESQLFQKSGPVYTCVGVCQSSPTETEKYKPPMRWRTAFICGGEVVASCQALQKDQQLSPGRPPIYENVAEHSLPQMLGRSFDSVVSAAPGVVRFSDGASYPVELDESFTDETLRPAPPSVCDQNIGECLTLWNMGVQEEYMEIDGTSTFIGVTINTRRHMYIFELTPGSIYCRAARFVATNRGVVFHQNFRQGFEAYMLADNAQARLPLEYDEALFDRDACSWHDRSVYWSLDSYNDTEIFLHGCQGERYCWNKPER